MQMIEWLNSHLIEAICVCAALWVLHPWNAHSRTEDGDSSANGGDGVGD